MPRSPSRRRRRSLKTGGWAVVVAGVLVSWVWSDKLDTAGEPTATATAGGLAFLLLAVAIDLLRRARPEPERRTRILWATAILACVTAGAVAGILPLAISAATTGTVTTTVGPAGGGTGYRLAEAADITSDDYRQTDLVVTVHARDRTAPRLRAVVSFTDGTADLRCANTRPVWIHEVSTVTLMCDDFRPVSSLRSIAAVSIVET
jgi:amino acid transporter